MTYLEKLKKNCPGLSYLAIASIVRSMCPHNFGYEDRKSGLLRCQIEDTNCEECWNREIPEKKKEDISNAQT